MRWIHVGFTRLAGFKQIRVAEEMDALGWLEQVRNRWSSWTARDVMQEGVGVWRV